jgi:hypothetical protein
LKNIKWKVKLQTQWPGRLETTHTLRLEIVFNNQRDITPVFIHYLRNNHCVWSLTFHLIFFKIQQNERNFSLKRTTFICSKLWLVN